MPYTGLGDYLNQMSRRPQGKPKSEFDISRTNDLGFSQGYGKSLEDALDEIYQRQVSEAGQGAQESALASGDFNPNLSSYYATKGAKEAQATGKVQAKQTARADEYNRFNVLNAINNYGLQKGYLDLQNKQYEDSKPGWLDDVFGALNTASNIVPFFKEGGEVAEKAVGTFRNEKEKQAWLDYWLNHNYQALLNREEGTIPEDIYDLSPQRVNYEERQPANPYAKGGQVGENKIGIVMDEYKKGKLHSGSGGIVKDRKQAVAIALSEARKHGANIPQKAGGGSVEDSDYFIQMYGGGIPYSEINSTTEPSGDNTLIKAQPGEVIQSNPAGDLMGRENLKTINEAGKMADNLFANAGNKMAGMVKPSGMNAMSANTQVPTQTLGQKFGEMVKGMFRGGSESAPAKPMAGGGDVSPFDAQIQALDAKRQALIQQLPSADDTGKQQIQTTIDDYTRQIQALEQQKQQWRLQQNPSNQLADGGEVIGNQEQPKVRSIQITEKPIV